MRLDAATGTVEVEPGLVIDAGTGPEVLRAAGSRHDGYANGWTWEQLERDGWIVAVSFDPDGRVDLVSLTRDDGGERGWDSFSVEREEARRDTHDAWLAEVLGAGWWDTTYEGGSIGRSGATPWGTVASDYDTRSGGSAITIRYR